MCWNKRILFLFSVFAFCIACNDPPNREPQLPITAQADFIGQHLHVTYHVVANRGDGNCMLPDGQKMATGPCYEARITLQSDTALDLSDAQFFFSQTDPVGLVENGYATIHHLNGDLHMLEFKADTTYLTPEQAIEITFIVKGLNLTKAKLMPNYYIVDANGDVALIDSTREGKRDSRGLRTQPHLASLTKDLGQLKRAAIDETRIATPQTRFAENADIIQQPQMVDTGIIPAPLSVDVPLHGGRLDLRKGVNVVLKGIAREKIAVALERFSAVDIAMEKDGIPLIVTLTDGKDTAAEGYTLTIASDQIRIEAATPAGAFYAIQSLIALITPGQSDIPFLTILDAPRFAFRGMHMDIARNFHGPSTILSIMDQMAAYKLNRLHLHLADDEGWRLEIPDLPELTTIGARRCHDPQEERCLLPQLGSGPFPTSSGTGYLSTDAYQYLLQEAQRRHIEVIPSFDMPGHARAAVKSMDARYRRLMAEGHAEQAVQFLLSDPDDKTEYLSIQYYKDNTINVCRDSTFAFIEKVLDTLISLHDDAGVPLKTYHLGADETAGAWVQSPICTRFLQENKNGLDSTDDLAPYFIERIARIIADKGVTPAAWSDGLSHANVANLPPNIQSNAWGVLSWGGAQTAHTHANRGWDVVVSTPDALYFDLPYEAHPAEGGYYWAARHVNTRKVFSMMPENLPAHATYWRDRDEQPFEIDDSATQQEAADYHPRQAGVHFAGMQGHIWTETIRDRETLEYQIFPRLLALAERAWHRADWELPYNSAGDIFNQQSRQFSPEKRVQQTKDWNRFASILVTKELPKLDMAGINYRLPPAGGVHKDGKLRVNANLPGLIIEAKNGDTWRPLNPHDASALKNDIPLRTKLPSGTKTSRVDQLLVQP